MSAATLIDAPWRPSLLDARNHGDGRDAPPATRGGPTLDELIVGVWEGLASGRAAACPVCSGPLAPRYGAGAAPVGARCGDCGTELS
jgi:hypothetical protein